MNSTDLIVIVILGNLLLKVLFSISWFKRFNLTGYLIFNYLLYSVISGTLVWLVGAKYNTLQIVILQGLFLISWKVFKNKEIERTQDLSVIDLLGNNGLDFEAYIASEFQHIGYNAKTTTELRHEGRLPSQIQNAAGSGEQGVDVVAFGRKKSYLVQCKQYSNTVGNDAVQEIFTALNLYGGFYKKDFIPVVVTNNYFSKSAKVLAKSNNVILIDRDDLLSIRKMF